MDVSQLLKIYEGFIIYLGEYPQTARLDVIPTIDVLVDVNVMT